VPCKQQGTGYNGCSSTNVQTEALYPENHHQPPGKCRRYLEHISGTETFLSESTIERDKDRDYPMNTNTQLQLPCKAIL
jgi:hypothetical protein